MGGGGRRKPPATYTDAQRLTAAWVKGWAAKFGEDPVVQPQDGKIFKTLATQKGVDLVLERLAAYFAWDDAFIEQAGYTVSMFHKSWNRLTAHLAKQATRVESAAPPDCRHVPRCRSAAAHTRRKSRDMETR